MLKGYPIGYIMLWESPADYESKKSAIGDNSKTYEEPKELVIDGQQRLTALVAAMYAVKVKDKNFADREIKISYNPLTREFAVWSQAYEKDTEWISRISDVFLAKEDNSISSLRRHFIKEANEGRGKKELPLLTDEEEDRIEDNINALLNLSDYSLPTLEISYTADEEDVADIFVRVNSGGQSLTENNFIQTLISVYENETSNKINAFAAASRVPAANTSYNTLLAIEPSHLIRMAVGVGFKRARLRYAYMLLRGKNLETGKFSDEVRHENLQIFKDALDKVMNLNNWHSFINIVAEAGYISDKLIASSNAIVFSYVLYLNAKYDYKLDAAQLKKCTSKWFFMSTITYFYTGSTESEVEKQFADLRDVHTAAEFIAYIDRVIETHFTDDYFSLTLPNELNSAAAISPAWYGYVAAQIVLNTPMLFSNTPVSKYFILGSSGTKNGNVKKCAVGKHPKSEKHGNTAQFSEVERSGTQENCGGIESGCRLRLRPLPVLRRRQSQRVARIDPNAVVVGKNIAENDRFDLFSRQLVCRDLVDLLFFERGEKTFHPCVVEAMSGAAEALYHAAARQLGTKG